MDVEVHNMQEIESLNQRGGRTLSIVDLVLDGTITAEMAALCWMMLDGGSGLLTGAVPGGAGKTTLMASLLAFLPPGEPIVSVSDPSVIRQAVDGGPRPLTLMAHEIGSGFYYGYVWGRDAAAFFSAAAHGVRCATCIHADTAEQSRQKLLSLGTDPADFARIGLQLYMHVGRRAGRIARRVSRLYCAADGAHRTVYEWDPDSDVFARSLEPDAVLRLVGSAVQSDPAAAEESWLGRRRFLEGLADDGVRRFEEVRSAVLDFYHGSVRGAAGAWERD